ncbi:hypothetical protein Unana1_01348 [Umbelopsis nana]
MGVRGLTPLLKRYAPRSLSFITANDLRFSRIAIDASCHLNKFVHATEPFQYPHIAGFYALARFCTHHNITPIFVFDGSTRLTQKYLEQQRRAKVRDKVKHSLAFERDRQQRLADWLSVVRSLTRDPSLPDVRRALESMRDHGMAMSEERAAQIVMDIEDEVDSTDKYPGGQKLQAKLLQIAIDLRDCQSQSSDSDKYTRTVRRLTNQEQVIMDSLIQEKLAGIKASLGDLSAESHNQLVSLDMDTLVFGDAPILRYFFAPSRPILKIDPIVARRELRLSKPAFIDMCILCGTDFSSTIRGIGAVRALEYMQTYGSIEAMMPNLPTHYVPNENFLYQDARKVFQSLPDIPSMTMYEPMTNVKDVTDLLSRYDIDPDEVEERLQVMSLLHSQSKQQAGWGKDPFASTTADTG